MVTFFIETNGSIPNEPKVNAVLKAIDNGTGNLNYIDDEPNAYNGNIGIEVRGATSSGYPQKPYGFETRDSIGENNNVKLLGLPKENDWVLLSNYNDKSLMRNALSFHLFEAMGHYAPRSKHCEVFLNGQYQGIYLFGEKIKQDKNRVAIDKLDSDDNADDSITGGYIFKNDYADDISWQSNFSPIDKPGSKVSFVLVEPSGDEITNKQLSYLKEYVNSYETVLYGPNFKDETNGYRAFVDINTFIDYFIIEEVSRNADGYKKSRFFYKDRKREGGKLCSGPVWDFDWAWKNLADCSIFRSTDGSGWAYKINTCSISPIPPTWIVRFMQDPLFVDQVYTRYTNLRKTILSEEYISRYADSISNLVADAHVRHFDKWKILGINNSATEVDYIPTTYEGEVDKLVNWIYVRLSWLDKNIKGNYIEDAKIELASNTIRVFPNPANEQLFVESDTDISKVVIYNLQAQQVAQQASCTECEQPNSWHISRSSFV